MTDKQRNILIEFERYLKLKSIKTFNRYILEVKEYFGYLAKVNEEYDQVKKVIGDEYRGYLLTERTLARGTVNNKLNRLETFYGFLLKKGHVMRNHFYYTERLKLGIIIPKNILSVEQMGTLLDNFAIYDDMDLMIKSMIEFLYGSALRISEVVSLKLNDVDFDRGFIYITESKNHDKRRKTVASEISLKTLKQYLKYSKAKFNPDSDYIYPKKKVGSYVNLLNKKLLRECERLDLPLISTHSFRHSSATHILRSGAGIREVQEFLGHKKISSTEVYTRIVKEDLKDVIEKHHPRELSREVEDEGL